MAKLASTAPPQASSSILRVLLAQENEQDARLLRHALEQSISCDITTCSQASAVLEILNEQKTPFDIVVIDSHLPDMSGLELCRKLLADNLPLPLVILIEMNSQSLAIEALKTGVDDYLVKDEAQNYLQLLPLVLPKVVQHYKNNQTQQQMEDTLEDIFNRVERAKQEWEATADALPQIVCLLDSQGDVIRSNRTVEVWQLAQVHKVKGRTIHHLFHPHCTQPDCYLNSAWPQAWQAVKRHQMAEFEAKDEKLERYLLWQIHPILTRPSQPDKQDASFAAVVIQDITERKLADRALQESLQQKERAYRQAQIYARELKAEITERERAEAALQQYTVELQARNEELDAFAHTVAHDLKNPLSPIMGYTRVALENYDNMSSTDIQTILQSILRNVYRMDNIIESLLLLAGVRNMEVELEPLNMADIMAETLERLADMISEYQPKIILPDHWPLAWGYSAWVEEVWVNYLSNALKYGGRPPRLELGATRQPKGMIRFWIRDNGDGLTPEQKSQIFTPFIRLNQALIEGHGLGLSIVDRIIEKLGGKVGAESRGVSGKGSEFFFTLPGKR